MIKRSIGTRPLAPLGDALKRRLLPPELAKQWRTRGGASKAVRSQAGAWERVRALRQTDKARRRSGLSLLEVVLALTILAVAAALLAQVSTRATNNGLMAQRLAVAQMLCESKMSEVLSGSIQLTSSSWTQITDSGRRGNWYYQIQTVTAQRPNMIGVRLSVTDQPEATNPELFFIVRWMIDPSTGLDTPPSTDTSTTSSGSSTGSASGSTSGSAGGIQ
jgi:general secretion pathway protein I